MTDNVITCHGINTDTGAGIEIEPNGTFCRGGAFVTVIIGSVDTGMNHLIVNQRLGIHQDVIPQIPARQCFDKTRVPMTINHQFNGVMQFCISAHRAADRRLTVIVRRLLDVDNVISGHAINGDMRLCVHIRVDSF
ncbi:hypothetical protein D3C81_930230 [compost metagenome]